MTEVIRQNPAWFLAAVCLLPLLPVVPFRWGWFACLAAFVWADSSMPGGLEARVARFGVLGLVLVQGSLRLRGVGTGEKVPWPAKALAAWAIASLAWTVDPEYTAVSLLVALLAGTLVFGLLPRLAPTTEEALRFFRGTTWLLLGLVLLGLVPWIHRQEFFTAGRLRGFFSNANGLGLACAFLAPWPLAFAPLGDRPARARAFLLVAFLAALALLSGSRTGFGGVLVGVAATLFLRHPSRLLVLVAFAGFAFSLWTFAGHDLDLEEGTTARLVRPNTLARVSGRLDRWRVGFDTFLEMPFTGHGYMANRRLPTLWLEERADGTTRFVFSDGQNPHSQPVETLVDLGIPGAALLVALLATIVRRFRRLALSARDARVAAAGAALTGTSVAVTLDSFFHNWLLTPGSPYALLFWAFVAIGLRLERLATRPETLGAAPAFAPRAALGPA